MQFGVMLSISTMAAAGLGNLLSDVAGVGMSGYIESKMSKAVRIVLSVGTRLTYHADESEPNESMSKRKLFSYILMPCCLVPTSNP